MINFYLNSENEASFFSMFNSLFKLLIRKQSKAPVEGRMVTLVEYWSYIVESEIWLLFNEGVIERDPPVFVVDEDDSPSIFVVDDDDSLIAVVAVDSSEMVVTDGVIANVVEVVEILSNNVVEGVVETEEVEEVTSICELEIVVGDVVDEMIAVVVSSTVCISSTETRQRKNKYTKRFYVFVTIMVYLSLSRLFTNINL